MSNQTQLLSESALLKNYTRHDVEFVKGEGAYLFDKNGKQYLDFLCGIAVTGFGHNHPKIKEAVQKQIDSFWHVSNLFKSTPQEILAEKLVSISSLDNVFFCNSGTEANEAAIKFARKWGKGRFSIISALGSFHGRTMGSVTASGQQKLWNGFEPLLPGFNYVPFNDVEAIKNSVTNKTVAVMLEPIQGEAGINVPSINYLKEVKELCEKNNLLLILDEVQTGIGRTGKFFCHQWNDVKPDIITSAKGIANGIPLGALICTEEIGNCITPGSHGSTFGGNPIAVASANSVIDLLTNDTLNKIYDLGEKIKELIKSINFDRIKSVRGKGLLIGVEFEKDIKVKDFVKDFLTDGILVGTAGENILRIFPPFIIEKKEIEIFINSFRRIINK